MRILEKGKVFSLDKIGMAGDTLSTLPGAHPPAPRHPARDRSDRLGQVDDAVLGDHRDQQPRQEHPHHRGSGRVRGAGHRPGAGEPQDRAHLRLRAARVPAAGPRRHPRRRDPGLRDGEQRGPGLAHRPPRVLHPAHQRQRHVRSRASSDMDVEPFLVADTMLGVLAQRLVRTPLQGLQVEALHARPSSSSARWAAPRSRSRRSRTPPSSRRWAARSATTVGYFAAESGSTSSSRTRRDPAARDRQRILGPDHQGRAGAGHVHAVRGRRSQGLPGGHDLRRGQARDLTAGPDQ